MGALRLIVRIMFTQAIQRIEGAAKIAEAEQLVDLPGLTLILSDIQLGDGLGPDLRRAGGPPLILMTALPPGDPLRVAAGGIVLTKPFDAVSLAETLNRVLHD